MSVQWDILSLICALMFSFLIDLPIFVGIFLFLRVSDLFPSSFNLSELFPFFCFHVYVSAFLFFSLSFSSRFILFPPLPPLTSFLLISFYLSIFISFFLLSLFPFVCFFLSVLSFSLFSPFYFLFFLSSFILSFLLSFFLFFFPRLFYSFFSYFTVFCSICCSSFHIFYNVSLFLSYFLYSFYLRIDFPQHFCQNIVSL